MTTRDASREVPFSLMLGIVKDVAGPHTLFQLSVVVGLSVWIYVVRPNDLVQCRGVHSSLASTGAALVDTYMILHILSSRLPVHGCYRCVLRVDSLQ